MKNIVELFKFIIKPKYFTFISFYNNKKEIIKWLMVYYMTI